jgi:pSer/pThr/pTyr-binding forkhead associated (FHA) protein
MDEEKPKSQKDNPFRRMNETLSTNDLREQTLRQYKLQQDQKKQEDEETDSAIIEGDVALHIEVEGADTPLLLALKVGDTVIGRRDPTQNFTPELDLSPYAAYQMGVSRRHALIRLQEKRLYLIDLGSRNGTFLNGYKLKPDTPASLRDGDEAYIGKIRLKIRLQGI